MYTINISPDVGMILSILAFNVSEEEDHGVYDMENWSIIPSVAEYLAGIEAFESQYGICTFVSIISTLKLLL